MLEKKWAGMTSARAAQEKNSKPAACASNPRTILFNQIACVLRCSIRPITRAA
jgi:hypothetical protein